MSATKGVAGLFLAFAVAFTATGASGESRPVVFGPGTVGEPSLQQILSDISNPDINASTDQTTHQLFVPGAIGSVSKFVVEVSGFETTNVFGIYEASDPTNKAIVYAGSDTDGNTSLIEFIGNTVVVDGSLAASNFTGAFGFYLDVTGGGGIGPYTLYSEDSRNPNDKAQALIYQGDGSTILSLPYQCVPDVTCSTGPFSVNEFIIAFEDLIQNTDPTKGLTGNSDGDFNDLVVAVESITPVPEPATLLLLGSGLVGAGIFGRKRLARKQS